jgi:hypothetical protein
MIILVRSAPTAGAAAIRLRSGQASGRWHKEVFLLLLSRHSASQMRIVNLYTTRIREAP